jgi:hypothetical protein
MCNGSTNFDACISQMGGLPQLSGPASVTSPTTQSQTKTTAADGSVTTVTTSTSTQWGVTYGTDPSPSMDMTPTTTTTTQTNVKSPQGVTVSDGTTTSTDSPTTGGQPQVAPTFSDSPFPAVSPFYTQKYPGGFQGVWNKNMSTIQTSAFANFLNSFVPNFSGSCPSWSMSFDIWKNAHFGTVSFVSLCSVFSFIKVIMLVTAMFTCRALIFGG